MKVLQINAVYNRDSTGRTCFELNKIMWSQGIESYIAYGLGAKPDQDYLRRMHSHYGYVFQGILVRLFGKDGHFSVLKTLSIRRWISKIKPDVVHLRVLHGNYINLPILFRYLIKHKIPIVISLHDFWFLTGHCPYPMNRKCDKYLSECHTCPAIKDYPKSHFFDTSRSCFREKQKYLSKLDVTIVGVSEWSAKIAASSAIGKSHRVTYVNNWIDLDVFSQKVPNDESVHPFWLTNPDHKKALFVSAFWDEQSQKFQDVLKLRKLLPATYDFILVGKVLFDSHQYQDLTFMGHTSSKSALATCYRNADVYVHLTHFDTFGKVVAEAICCGTPVVAFNVTALPDVIGPNCGKVIDNFDLNKMSKAIVELADNKKDYARACEEHAQKDFNMEVNAQKLIDIYRGIYEEHTGDK